MMVDMRNLFMNWLRRFGLIHGFTMMVVYLICKLVNAGAVFDVAFLGNMILFSLAATVPGLIYYSRREITNREWWIRTVIHYILLNLLLLPIARMIGLWDGVDGCLIFAGLIIIVDVLVHVLSFGKDWIVARDINRVLREKRTESLKNGGSK